jgi:hypothetical protein
MHYQGETSDTNWVEVHLQVTLMGQPLDGALVGAGSLWPCHDSSNHDAKGLKMLYSLLSMRFICVLKVNVQICQETCCVALTLENSALAGVTRYLVGRMLYVNPQTHHMAP